MAADVTVGDLVGLVPVLAGAYGVVMGVVAMSLGWELFRDRAPGWFRRSVQVPPEGATGHDPGRGA